MPYPTAERRGMLDEGMPPKDVGDLTYVLTNTVRKYWITSTRRYLNIAEIFGALIATTLEVFTQIYRKYEDKKIQENGGMFWGD